jgi:SDR family mycofactocin-dependent oxidoreductase
VSATSSASRLVDHVVLISGVARGQGRSHALRCVAEGAAVIGFDLCEDIGSVPYPLATEVDLETTVQLVEKAGGKIVAAKADVRDRKQIEAVLDRGLERFGALNAVIANAGIFCGAGEVAHTEGAWQDTIDVNLTGTFNMIETAVPALIETNRGGSIVITSSGAGLKAMIRDRNLSSNGYLSYNASKHGLVGLMRSYALMLAPHRVRVNSIHPTGVNTAMIDNSVVQEYFASQAGNHLLGNAMPVEAIEPEDVSDAVIWLCSDESKYVTGVALPVDAGSLLL